MDKLKQVNVEQSTKKEPKPLPKVTFYDDNLPEISDYDVGEEVTLHLVCKLVNKTEVDKEAVKKDNMYPDSNRYELQIKKCMIMNKKEAREKSESMGIDKKDYDEIELKRKKRREEIGYK